MANTFQTTELVANLALAKFVNNNSLVMTANRGYEGDFKMQDYRIGDSLNIRTQNRFVVGDGRIGQPQDVIETVETLTIDHQYHTLIEYNSKELTLDIDTGMDRFSERYIDPAIQEIVHRMEVDIALQAINELNFLVGTPGSPINSFQAVDSVGVKMLEQAMPILRNAYYALGVRDASALKSSLQNAFNDTLNEDISFESRLGHLSYFDIFQNQAIPRHTAGSALGAPVVNGAVASGNVVVLSGLTPTTTGVFLQGDVVTFGTFATASAVNSVNPIGRADTGQLMQFVVLADVDSDGGGAATLTIAPAVISDPGNPRRNVTQAIPDAAVVTLIGANTTYNVNLAYAPRGLDIVVPPLARLDIQESYVKTDKDANVSIRVSKQGDIINDVNVLRLDVLCGYKWHAEYAVKSIS